jgi:hypothetical protein
MNPLKAIVLGLMLAATAIAGARAESTIMAATIICVTKSGIEATRADMNTMQLRSLGCVNVLTDHRVDVLPPSVSCEPYLFVAVTLPDEILRRWIRRVEFDGRLPTTVNMNMDCLD